MTVVVTGYGGTFRATVVDDDDPMRQSRLQVVVAEVYGDSVPVWAAALRTDDASASPAIGDLVWVSFEHGDSDYPVWQADQGADQGVPPAAGYVGKYRGVVVDNMDPQEERRIEVTVPDVYPYPAWATPGVDDNPYDDPPAVGSEVWIEYECGDPAFPRWVGRA
jgi:hypothetical protein